MLICPNPNSFHICPPPPLTPRNPPPSLAQDQLKDEVRDMAKRLGSAGMNLLVIDTGGWGGGGSGWWGVGVGVALVLARLAWLSLGCVHSSGWFSWRLRLPRVAA